MAITDAEGRYARVNRALCQLLGQPPEELLGTPLYDSVHPDDLALEAELMEELVGGKVRSYEAQTRRLRPGGQVVWVDQWVSVALDEEGAPLFSDENGRPGYVIRQLIDVTEERRLTEELEQARRVAVDANEAKTEFLSRLSHELRTPLTTVTGFAEMIGRDGVPAQHREALDHIMDAARHIVGLVDDLLDLSVVEEGRLRLSPQPVAVAPVLAEVHAMVQGDPRAGEKTLTVSSPTDGMAVEADPRRLVQILLNLLTNALKFTGAGGTVSLWARRAEAVVELGVTDTGPGLTAEQQRRLFVPFERLGADAAGIPGLGLGLAVSRRLAEAMGGGLSVRSAPGQGAEFVLSLPAASDTPKRAAAGPFAWSDELHGALVGRPWSVLYVEDNAINARLVDAVLARWTDAELVVATSGQEGLDVAATRPFDVVLLDLHLPDLPGDEVLARLRSAGSVVPVVAVTADASPARVESLLRAGASAFVAKPIVIAEFLGTLARVLEEGRPQQAG
jgi:PAS domain S-box-containing protein